MSTNVSRNPAKQAKQAPEKKIGPFAGGVGAAIWLNRIDTEQGSRVMRSITINPRRYFDQESQQWRDAPSYNPADLPALIFALTKAQEYCYETPLPGAESGGDQPNDLPPDNEVF